MVGRLLTTDYLHLSYTYYLHISLADFVAFNMADHGSNIDFCTLGMFIIGML